MRKADLSSTTWMMIDELFYFNDYMYERDICTSGSAICLGLSGIYPRNRCQCPEEHGN